MTTYSDAELPVARGRLSLRYCLMIFVLALSCRMIYWAEIRGFELYTTPLVDAGFYDEWAKDLAGVESFEKPVHHQAPLFPFLLSLVYRVFGPRVDAMVFLNFLMGAATAVAIALLAARAFIPKVGRVAGVLAALYVPFFFNDATIMPTSLNILLYVLILLQAQRLFSEGGFRNAALLGAIGGIGFLCRAEMALLLFFLGVGYLLKLRLNPRKSLAVAGAAFVGLAPFLVVYGIYYQSLTGEFRVLPSSGGLNLYLGNNPESKGTAEPPSTLSRNRDEIVVAAKRLAEETAGRELNEKEISDVLRGLAVEFMTSQPGAYLRLLITKAWLFVHGGESCDILHYGFMSEISWLKRIVGVLFDFRVIGAFAVIGLLLGANYLRGNAAVLYLLVLSTLVTVLLFSVSTRYRLPAAPPFLCFAAFSLVAIQQCFKARKTSLRAVAIVVVSSVLLGLLNMPSDALSIKYGQVWINVAVVRARAGDHRGAIEALEQSLVEEPEAWKPWQLLGQYYLEVGEDELAEKAYRIVVERSPGAELSWFNLGVVLRRLGRIEEAIAVYEEGLKALPDSFDLCLGLAIRFSELEMWSRAVAPARRAVALDSQRAEGNNQLAWVLLHAKERSVADVAEALRLARKAAVASDRRDAGILDTLAVALDAAGNRSEAAVVRFEIRAMEGGGGEQ